MTTPASDLMLSALPILHTPKLDAAVQDYAGVMGFEVAQHVSGVVAVLRVGHIHLYLWQQGADVRNGAAVAFKPGHHRVAVGSAFDAFSNLVGGFKKLGRTAPPETQALLIHRLSGPPKLQPWGAWEFSLVDADGNVLHMVQWVATGAFATPSPKIPAREVLPGLRRKL